MEQTTTREAQRTCLMGRHGQQRRKARLWEDVEVIADLRYWHLQFCPDIGRTTQRQKESGTGEMCQIEINVGNKLLQVMGFTCFEMPTFILVLGESSFALLSNCDTAGELDKYRIITQLSRSRFVRSDHQEHFQDLVRFFMIFEREHGVGDFSRSKNVTYK